MELYFSKYKNGRVSDINWADVRSGLIQELVNYDGELFNEDKILENVALSNEYLSKMQLVNISSGRMKSTLNTNDFLPIIEFLRQNGEISIELRDELVLVYNMVSGMAGSSEEILKYVNNLNSSKWSEQDNRYLNVFVQVYNSSYTYWTSQSNSGAGGRDLTNGNVVMLADTAGALFSLIANNY